jgi:hypothetical protein
MADSAVAPNASKASARPYLEILFPGDLVSNLPRLGGWISLDFLGFSRPNRALSKGYAEFSRKVICCLSLAHDRGSVRGTQTRFRTPRNINAHARTLSDILIFSKNKASENQRRPVVARTKKKQALARIPADTALHAIVRIAAETVRVAVSRARVGLEQKPQASSLGRLHRLLGDRRRRGAGHVMPVMVRMSRCRFGCVGRGCSDSDRPENRQAKLVSHDLLPASQYQIPADLISRAFQCSARPSGGRKNRLSGPGFLSGLNAATRETAS